MQTPKEINGWRIEDAENVADKDGLKPLNCRDLFDALGLSITQTLNSITGNMINSITIQCPYRTKIANQLPHLISRIGRSEVHIARSKLHKRS